MFKNSEVQTCEEMLDTKNYDAIKYLKQIDFLKEELTKANDKIKNLEESEEKLKIKLNQAEKKLNEKLKKPVMIDHYSSTRSLVMTESENKESNDLLSELASEGYPQLNNNQCLSELTNFYNNLNTRYRNEAYQALDLIHDMKPMSEFKIKLLFSVIVVIFIL